MRHLLRIAGLAVTLAAVAYVVREILRQDALAVIDWQPTALIAQYGPATLAYAAAALALAAAWYGLLAAGGAAGARPIDGVGAYALTQINKYLPSNVLHLAGRHIMLRRAGASHAALLGAATAEIVLILGTAMTLALIGAQELVGRVLAPAWWLVPVGVAALTVVGLLARARIGPLLTAISLPRALLAAAVAVAIYLLFFLVTGLIAGHLLGQTLNRPSPVGTATMVSLMSLAWAAGFVVPGSAAGFGVRESVLILTLGPLAGEQAAVVVATGYRIVTLAGDVLLFGLGAVWWGLRRWRGARAHG
jgi:hypothetical protein